MPTPCTSATIYSLAEYRRLRSILQQWPLQQTITDGTLFSSDGFAQWDIGEIYSSLSQGAANRRTSSRPSLRLVSWE